VDESNGQDVQVPWFSGLCLEGEVAGQYEIERSGSQQEPQDTGVAGVLALDGLAPITIFVGANNSGKSRLMREMFANSEATKCLRMGSDPDQLKIEMNDFLKLLSWPRNFKSKDQSNLLKIMAATDVFKEDYRDWIGEADDGWIGVNAVSLLDAINATIDPYLRGDKRVDSGFSDSGRFGGSLADNASKNAVATAARSAIEDWSRSFEVIRKSQFCSRMNDYLSLRRCYVPMLRGMRPPLASVSSDRQSNDATDCYEGRSILDYFTNLPSWRTLNNGVAAKFGHTQQKQALVFSEKPRIFTGLSLYRDIQKRLLAPTYEERKSIRDYEIFLSVNFFQGREVTLTPALQNQEGKDNDVVHIKIGESKDRPIYDLGDGMQSLIICTYPIITELQRGSLFFLEEPDLCMHPSLQRIFLKVLRESYTEKGHQFFLTTHSNHLLDLLEDDDLVSIFSFSEIADRALAPAFLSQTDGGANSKSSKPQPQFRIRPSDLRDRRTLLELGVRPSATYLANATIWVEGVSDCAYLRAYMEALVHYLKIRGNDWGKNGINGKSLAQRLEEYKEDRHYAFVEYSGANLTHFSFKDAECDEGQGQATSSIVTNVPYLCSKAIVIADGDITNSNKGDRWKRFVSQLDEHFIGLPCKEIENLIPDGLMQNQVKKDDSNIDVTRLAEIKYADYRKLEMGVGDYLASLDFVTNVYADKSGTLTAYRKKMWSSNDKGIPWLVRQEVERDVRRDKDSIGSPVNTGNIQSIQESVAIPELPSYLTQDLIWLCVCLYAHIANCNHDQEAEQKLKEFQQFIRDQGKVSRGPTGDPDDGKQAGVESDNPADSAAPEWPIKDVKRNCLLKAFLLRQNNAESTPSLSAEPNPASTSSAPGPTASPAS